MKVTVNFDTPWTVDLEHEDDWICFDFFERNSDDSMIPSEGIALTFAEARYFALQILAYCDKEEPKEEELEAKDENYN